MNHLHRGKLNKVICIGIGGKSLYYVSNFLLNLDITVIGYDIEKSTKTTILEKNGATIYYNNPQKKLASSDLVLYSDALPDQTLSEIKAVNPKSKFMEVGAFINYLISLHEESKFSEKQKRAFKESKVAPLYELEFGNEKLIGVTGTDGKTTVVSMIHHILSKHGYTPGTISTIEARIGNRVIDIGSHTTTPPQQDTFELILQMQKEKCSHIILECTSQGLFMGRLAGLLFDVVVFTNITNEHLGYHNSWERYAEAKFLLIQRHLRKSGTTVLNLDDRNSYRYLKKYAKETIEYSIENPRNSESADVTASDLEESTKGVTFSYGEERYSIPIMGKYNVSNALAAACALRNIGIDIKSSLSALTDFPGIEGRMQVIQKVPFMVIVDFAHTPNGLLSALKTARTQLNESNKLILVFGCAAKRDETKRITMGKYAKKYAETTILTAEDPRTEKLVEINNQIEKGWNSQKSNMNKQLIRFDDERENVKVRRDAIKKALSLANRGDLVLITGKGHEKSLCFGRTEYPWSDIDETKKLLS